jgi:hypothetical protein
MKGDSSNTSGKQDFQKPSMTEIFEATIGDKRQDMRNKPQRFFAWYHPCSALTTSLNLLQRQALQPGARGREEQALQVTKDLSSSAHR